ncbi:hypothetical protein PR048_028110 [Dryococelus australis]|uniref:Uncharacterized protein n=1 Tax=Dryococelus australis TaxID=614101 RepID=A0ABQ9GIB3_9NEOP|nr:hypothetical protein PR048_028110 [Dryococelus australis]
MQGPLILVGCVKNLGSLVMVQTPFLSSAPTPGSPRRGWRRGELLSGSHPLPPPPRWSFRSKVSCARRDFPGPTSDGGESAGPGVKTGIGALPSPQNPVEGRFATLRMFQYLGIPPFTRLDNWAASSRRATAIFNWATQKLGIPDPPPGDATSSDRHRILAANSPKTPADPPRLRWSQGAIKSRRVSDFERDVHPTVAQLLPLCGRSGSEVRDSYLPSPFPDRHGSQHRCHPPSCTCSGMIDSGETWLESQPLPLIEKPTNDPTNTAVFQRRAVLGGGHLLGAGVESEVERWSRCSRCEWTRERDIRRDEVIRGGASCTGKRDWGRKGKSAMAFVSDPSQHSSGVISEKNMDIRNQKGRTRNVDSKEFCLALECQPSQFSPGVISGKPPRKKLGRGIELAPLEYHDLRGERSAKSPSTFATEGRHTVRNRNPLRRSVRGDYASLTAAAGLAHQMREARHPSAGLDRPETCLRNWLVDADLLCDASQPLCRGWSHLLHHPEEDAVPVLQKDVRMVELLRKRNYMDIAALQVLRPPAHWTTATMAAQCETNARLAARPRSYSVPNVDDTELAVISHYFLYCLSIAKKNRQKQNRGFWVHPFTDGRFIKQTFCRFYNELRKHEEKFMKYTRMSVTSFNELLETI